MVILSLVALLLQNPIVTGERSLVSKCAVSEDAKYGHSRSNPIKVGGTPTFGPARQRRFLQSLVGPAGQAVAFKRVGSLAPDGDGIIIDHYEVTYPGADKPISLYLDLYRWDPPEAPQGFFCGSEIGLAPPPDPAAERVQYFDHAIKVAAGGGLTPIPLGADGSTRHGVSIDGFRFAVGAARARAAAGDAVKPEHLLKIQPGQYLVIAYELSCDGRRREPQTIEARARNRQPITPRGDLIETRVLRRMIPWTTLPDGAVGRMFAGPHLPMGGEVVITYDGAACPGEPESALLPVKAAAPTKLVEVLPVPPPGVTLPPDSVVRVQIRATLDIEGVPTNLEVVSGPSAYVTAATDAVRQWRYGPVMINGAPTYVPTVMVFTVTFTGERGPK